MVRKAYGIFGEALCKVLTVKTPTPCLPPSSLVPCALLLTSRAVGVGILKVMAKMGISTVASYKGAQIFEVRGTCDTAAEAW